MSSAKHTTVSLRPLRRADIPTIVTFSAESFEDDEMVAIINPHNKKHPGCLRRGLLRLHRSDLHRPGMFFLVAEADDPAATDDAQSKVIVGFVAWIARGPNPVAARWKAINASWASALEMRLLAAEAAYGNRFDARHSDPKACATFGRNVSQTLGHSPKANIMLLRYCVTAKEWQGRGVGRTMVEWGLEVAAEQGLPVVVGSSPIGRGFYERLGFKVVRWTSVDEEGTVKIPELVWEPPGSEGRWVVEDGLAGYKVRQPKEVPMPHDFGREYS